MIASYDFSSGWTFDNEPDDEFGIRFTDANKERAYPTDLSFGYDLTVNGEATETHVWPPPGVIIRELAQTRVFPYRVAARPDDEIVLKVWATNDGQTRTSETSWIIPRPVKPYDSWTWDNTDRSWIAPIPYPKDSDDYVWNEKTQSWDPENSV